MSNAVNERILFDGVGTAATAVIGEFVRSSSDWGNHTPPIRLVDNAFWKQKHAARGLIPRRDVNEAKAVAEASRLREAGYAVDACVDDVRHLPRGDYLHGITVAATDSHETKYCSVQSSLQAGSPAIAMGLGPGQATVEIFTPGGAGYCCVHANDASWTERIPCRGVTPISTTAIALRNHGAREVVDAAGKLVARLIADYLATGQIVGNRGALLRGASVQWFQFSVGLCEGPHDAPFHREKKKPNVTKCDGGADRRLLELLAGLGEGAQYEDRELAWNWICERCQRMQRRLHTVFPPTTCEKCRSRMFAGPQRVSGLKATEIQELGGAELSLRDLGLEHETVLRCSVQGELTWLILTNDNR